MTSTPLVLNFRHVPTSEFVQHDFVDTVPNDLVQVEVILKGESIVTIDLHNGKMKVIVFRPSKATLDTVRNFEGLDVDLHVDDVNGSFTPRRAQRIVDHVWTPSNRTLIVDTENQK